VTASEVEAALRSSLEERSTEFEQLWETMTPDGKRALHVLSRSMSAGETGENRRIRREKSLPRLPLSETDRQLLLRGGVLYRYDKKERLLSSFEEWIRGDSS
jgi:hypothetical protein